MMSPKPQCGVPALDVGGVTPTCERDPGHTGKHARTLIEDGEPRTYQWGKGAWMPTPHRSRRAGTTLSYEARAASERPLVSFTVARATKDALTTLAERSGISRGLIVDDAVRELWSRYERGEWPSEDDE